MGGEVCYQKGKERGPWFEIKCVKEIILSKEIKGEDATFERNLLRSWSEYPGWGNAEMPPRNATKSKIKGIEGQTSKII